MADHSVYVGVLVTGVLLASVQLAPSVAVWLAAFPVVYAVAGFATDSDRSLVHEEQVVVLEMEEGVLETS